MCCSFGTGRSARGPLATDAEGAALTSGTGTEVATTVDEVEGAVSCLLSQAARASKMTIQRVMLRRLPRSIFVVVFSLLPSETHAADPPLTATMQCDRTVEPGRVKCTATATPDAQHTIAWADVAIVSLPDLASALKGRLGQSDATQRDATGYKWAFALIAKKTGSGEAKLRVRATVCEGTSTTRCIPVTVDVAAPVTVGS